MDKDLSIEDKEKFKDQLNEIKKRIEDLKSELNSAEYQLELTISKIQGLEKNNSELHKNKIENDECIKSESKQVEIRKIKNSLEELLKQLEKKEKKLLNVNDTIKKSTDNDKEKKTEEKQKLSAACTDFICQNKQSCGFALENQSSGLFLSINEYEQVETLKGFKENRQIWIIKYKKNNQFCLKNRDTNKYLETNKCGVVYTNIKSNNASQYWIFKDLKIQNVETNWILDSRDNGDVLTRPESVNHSQNWVVHRELDIVKSYEPKILWRSNKNNIEYIKEDCCNWIKKENGKIKFKYELIEENKDHVILINRYTKKFVKLENAKAKYGCSLDKIESLFDSGTWVKKRDNPYIKPKKESRNKIEKEKDGDEKKKLASIQENEENEEEEELKDNKVIDSQDNIADNLADQAKIISNEDTNATELLEKTNQDSEGKSQDEIPLENQDNQDEIKKSLIEPKEILERQEDLLDQQDNKVIDSQDNIADNLADQNIYFSGNKYFTIENLCSNLYLDSDRCSNVYLYEQFHGNFHQVWELIPTDNDSFFLKNKQTSKYLESDIFGSIFTNLHSNHLFQLWKFNNFSIQNCGSQLYLNANATGYLSLSSFKDILSQKWKLHSFDDSYVLCPNRKVWKADSVDKFFVLQDESSVWIEKLNGHIVNVYRCLNENAEFVILYDVSKNIFIKLNQFSASWGCSIDKINYKFHSGKWI